MALKDRIRRTIASRPTTTTAPPISQTTSPTTSEHSSRSNSTASFTQPLALTQTMATLKTAPTADSANSFKSSKTSSSLKSISKAFNALRREKKEIHGRRYDPAEAARLKEWTWNDGARRVSVWSSVSPTTSRRGSAVSGYAVKQEIEIVEVETRLEALVV